MLFLVCDESELTEKGTYGWLRFGLNCKALRSEDGKGFEWANSES